MDVKRHNEILKDSSRFAHDIGMAMQMAQKTPNDFLVEEYSERFNKILKEPSDLWGTLEGLRLAIFDLLNELGFSRDLADSVSHYIGPDR